MRRRAGQIQDLPAHEKNRRSPWRYEHQKTVPMGLDSPWTEGSKKRWQRKFKPARRKKLPGIAHPPKGRKHFRSTTSVISLLTPAPLLVERRRVPRWDAGVFRMSSCGACHSGSMCELFGEISSRRGARDPQWGIVIISSEVGTPTTACTGLPALPTLVHGPRANPNPARGRFYRPLGVWGELPGPPLVGLAPAQAIKLRAFSPEISPRGRDIPFVPGDEITVHFPPIE